MLKVVVGIQRSSYTLDVFIALTLKCYVIIVGILHIFVFPYVFTSWLLKFTHFVDALQTTDEIKSLMDKNIGTNELCIGCLSQNIPVRKALSLF